MDIYELEKNGQLFEGWHIVKLIGEGGFGNVYEIERNNFGITSRSALKHISIPKNQNDVNELMSEGMDEASAASYFRGYVEELARECDLMSRLRGNSHIVSFEDYKIIEHKEDVGWEILIRMELLTPLIEYMKSHTLHPEEVIDIGVSVCDALTVCKKQNIMHRDVKPANIFVSDNGDYKLGDFGISRIVEKSNGASTKVGTTDYMAPEVYKGGKYDSSVDIYSLGLVLYRLLNNNRLPFLPPAPQPITHSQREEAVAKRMSGEALPMPANADNSLYEIIRKASAYDPADRYTDPEEMKADLLRAKGVPVQSANGYTMESVEPVHNVEQIVSNDDSYDDITTNTVSYEDEKTIPAPRAEQTEIQETHEDDSLSKRDDRSRMLLGIVVCLCVICMVVGVVKGIRNKEKTDVANDIQIAEDSPVTDVYEEPFVTDTNDNNTKEAEEDVVQTTTDSNTVPEVVGTIELEASTILVGDTVNVVSFHEGDDLILFKSGMPTLESSDPSIAKVRMSSDGHRYVIEGKTPGNVVITANYEGHVAKQTLRVVDYPPILEDNFLVLGFDHETLLEQLPSDASFIMGGRLEIPVGGATNFTLRLGEYFSLCDVDLSNMYNNTNLETFLYTSEDAVLSAYGFRWDYNFGDISITIDDQFGGHNLDYYGVPTVRGHVKMLMMDENNEYALFSVIMPFTIEE